MISPVLGAYDEECASCHKNMEPIIGESEFLTSTHGASGCAACHADASTSHPGNAVDCGTCHGGEYTKDVNWDTDKHDIMEASATSEATQPEDGEEETPGFEAAIAIVGLLAVAFLIRRRR